MKDEFKGALSAAIITLPMAIAYGITAFAALGPEFRPSAALIGVNAALFGGFFAALLGGAPVQISGPKAPLTLITTTLVVGLAADLAAAGDALRAGEAIVALVSMTVMIGGAVQLLMAWLGIGSVVKYIPHPVVAGFMNGIALLLIYNELPAFFGIERGVPLLQAISDFDRLNMAAALIGSGVLAATYAGRRYVRRIPAILSGLLGGAVVYLILSFPGMPLEADKLPAIGSLDSVVPRPLAMLWFFDADRGVLTAALLLQLTIYGLALGVVGAMESLMSAIAIDDISAGRHDSRKELVGQGAGNLIASLFGALFSAGSFPRSAANYLAGGRRRSSGMLCSLLILAMYMLLAPVIGNLPLPVIAAIIVYVGIGLFDPTTLRLLKALRTPSTYRKEIGINLLINGCVAAITVSVNLVMAVLIGLLISAAYFIAKTGNSVVRREYTGQRAASNKTRDLKLSGLLKQNGRRIVVFELQGPLFFGSADRVAQRLETAAVEAEYCILDMKHVSDIDSTGANILNRLYRILRRSEKWLLISHIAPAGPLMGLLALSGVTRVVPAHFFFEDTDQALEWAEEHLLERLGARSTEMVVALEEFDLLVGFDAPELEIFRSRLEHVTIKRGERFIREGELDRTMYMLIRGSVSVKMHLAGGNRSKRLFTLGAGVVLGEIALLDGGPRSANVQADDDSEAYCLSYPNYEKLLVDHPQIAAKLLKNIALVLGHRLRIRSDELRLLVDG